MIHIVSITSQGQVSIPAKIRREIGFDKEKKAIVKREGNRIILVPLKDFWTLGGVFKSNIKLSDADLKKARDSFSREWSNER